MRRVIFYGLIYYAMPSAEPRTGWLWWLGSKPCYRMLVGGYRQVGPLTMTESAAAQHSTTLAIKWGDESPGTCGVHVYVWDADKRQMMMANYVIL